MCRSLVEGVLPRPEVKAFFNEHFVAVASDCDEPEASVGKLVAENMSHATMLPFCLYADADGRFLHGTSGGATPPSFLADLRRVAGAGAP
jgi:hypothetical protein